MSSGCKRKTVPKDVESLIKNEWTLLTWFLDDGSRRSDCAALRLHTNSFSREECQLLVSALRENFAIDCTIHKAPNPGDERDCGYILHLGVTSGAAKKFSALVKPLCAQECPSMLYKFL